MTFVFRRGLWGVVIALSMHHATQAMDTRQLLSTGARVGFSHVLPYTRMVWNGTLGVWQYYKDYGKQGISYEEFLKNSSFSDETKRAMAKVIVTLTPQERDRARIGNCLNLSMADAAMQHDYLFVLLPKFNFNSESNQLGILAHETGHLKKKHTYKRIIASFVIPLLTEAVFYGATKGIELFEQSARDKGGIPWFCWKTTYVFFQHPVIKYAAAHATLLWFYRRQESEADLFAAEAGFGREFRDSLDKLPECPEKHTTNDRLLGSHNESVDYLELQQKEMDVHIKEQQEEFYIKKQQKQEMYEQSMRNYQGLPYLTKLAMEWDEKLGGTHPNNIDRIHALEKWLSEMQKKSDS